MSEQVTVTGSGTFGALAQEQTETSEQPQQTHETGNASVDTNGQLQTETTEAVVETTQPEFNESSFNIGFDDEPAQQEAAAQAQQQPQFNIDEYLKQADRKELAKKIGISEFALEIDEHLSRGGSASDYISAKGVNWDNVSDLDILKSDFAKKYSMLDAESQSYLFNKKYGLGELDDDEVKREKEINIKIDAAQLRGEKKSEQSKFKMPEARTQTEQNAELAQIKADLQGQQQRTDTIKQYIANHPSVQSLIQSKRVAVNLGEGVKPFNFNIDKPELLVKAMVDNNVWQKIISNDKGELNVEKLQRIVKYAANPDQHDRDIFNYGKSQGVKVLVEEGQNAKRPDGKSVIPTNDTGLKVVGSGKVGKVRI